jgi:hypothetical protein
MHIKGRFPLYKNPQGHFPDHQNMRNQACFTGELKHVVIPQNLTAVVRSAAAKQGSGPGAVTEQLAAFENGSYNLEARLAGLSEKGVSRLRTELGHLEAEASDGVRRAVHQHYTHYIKASQVRACVPFSIIFRWSRLEGVHQHCTHYVKASQVRACVPFSIMFRWSRLDGVHIIGELEREIQNPTQFQQAVKGRVLAGVLGIGNLESEDANPMQLCKL